MTCHFAPKACPSSGFLPSASIAKFSHQKHNPTPRWWKGLIIPSSVYTAGLLCYAQTVSDIGEAGDVLNSSSRVCSENEAVQLTAEGSTAQVRGNMSDGIPVTPQGRHDVRISIGVTTGLVVIASSVVAARIGPILRRRAKLLVDDWFILVAHVCSTLLTT